MEINNQVIPVNENGMYSLGDIFIASCAPKTKSPQMFLKLGQSRELESFLGNKAMMVVNGSGGGSYGNKHMTLAYAMWVSPKLYVKVMDTFLKVAEGDLHGAAMEANTDASRAAAMRLSMSYVESDRLMFRDKEKAIELLKSANMSEETFKDRTKNNIKVEMTTFLSKKRKSSDLITEVTRIAAFKHGVTDSNLIFECYNDMLDDGVIRSDGVYVTIV